MYRGSIPLVRFVAALGVSLIATINAVAAKPQPVSETITLREYAALSGSGIAIGPPIYYLAMPPIGKLVLASGTSSLPDIVPPAVLLKGGVVDLAALQRSGTVSGTVDVTVHGFPAGPYTVSAVTESSSDTIVLGSLSVVSGSIPIILSNTSGQTASYLPIPWISTGTARFGVKAHPFPAGFNPFDVAEIAITDSNENLVASAALTPVPDGFLTILSPVQPGSLARGATGYALLHASTKTGVVIPLTASVGMTTDAETSTNTPPSDSGGTLTLGNSGTVTLSGTGNPSTLGGSGSVVLGGSSNGYTGGTTLDGGTLTFGGAGDTGGTISAGTFDVTGGGLTFNPGGSYAGAGGITLSGSSILLDSGTIGGVNLTQFGPGTITFGVPTAYPLPANPATGRVTIHAHGLPPHIWVTYALDGTDIGKALTDTKGNLIIFANQGASGKIPQSLDLFSVTTLTVHNGAGKVYLTASF